MMHVCYVCRRIMVAELPTDDRIEPKDEPENTSHGVCRECQPEELSRIARELATLGI